MIRLNPDAVIYDETRLRGLLAQPSVYGVFANCNTFCDENAIEPCDDSKSFLIMTDFLAFRPDKALYHRWFENSLKHSESWCSQSFLPILESGNFAWIQSYNNISACRIAQEDIGHTHEKWTVRLDYVIAGKTSCPQAVQAPCRQVN